MYFILLILHLLLIYFGFNCLNSIYQFLFLYFSLLLQLLQSTSLLFDIWIVLNLTINIFGELNIILIRLILILILLLLLIILNHLHFILFTLNYLIFNRFGMYHFKNLISFYFMTNTVLVYQKY